MNASLSLLLGALLSLPAAADRAITRGSAASARRRDAAASRRSRAPKTAAKPTPIVPLHPPRVSTEPITFIWPPEGLVVPADNEFVLGNVEDAKAHFTINGQTVAVHKDGGFLAWLPVSAGTFTFRGELVLSSGAAVAERRILVPPPAAPLPDGKLAIDPLSLSPKADLELRAGDWWTARMKATRGRRARMRIGSGPWIEMREANRALGLYEANLQVQPGEIFGPAAVEYEIGAGWSAERLKGPAAVSASARTPAVATIKHNPAGFANVKAGPTDGFMLFPPAGTRMLASGRDGGSVRVEIAPGLSGWIEARDVELSTTAAAPPRAETGSIEVAENASGAVLRLGLSDRVPFDVVEDDDLNGLTLRIYSAVGRTNWIMYSGGSDFVDQARWRQEADGVVAVRVRLKPGRRVWGWHGRFEGGLLRLDLRRPPRADPKKPLAGLKIMLDPGHMPSAPGATGPLGTKEMDANYAIAQAVAARLVSEGAVPLLTRGTTTDEVSLTDRPRQALERGADVFVSLHNNALPDGTNPFAKPRGFTVFYYHPHSLALGRAMHAAYAERVKLPDEGLQWGNLLVGRLPAMPAILIENAHMIVPEEEAMLNDPAFRDALAQAVVAGLKSFAAEACERPSPARPAAAERKKS